MTQDLIRPVILSGGAGTRLWPMSRRARPKQLLSLAGPEAMITATVRRVVDKQLFAAPIIVCATDQGEAIGRLVADAGYSAGALLLESAGRNTAPAIALAAHWAVSHGDPLLLVMPSDHVIADVGAFRAAVRLAMAPAQAGRLVTFGITPDRAETGYGYIERGPPLGAGVFEAQRFVEKPDGATAQAYVNSGRFDWNAGIFLLRASVLLAAMAVHAPAIAEAVAAAWKGRSEPAGTMITPDPAAWARCPAQSIDYAVMETAKGVAVVPVAMGWSDVGSWDALADLARPDDAGVVAVGDVLAFDAANCLLRSDGPLVAAVGVRDLCIIATPDAVLIVPRGRAQEVRRVVEALAAAGRTDLL
jgi:mannose-1-phosphate guanylyltransferase